MAPRSAQMDAVRALDLPLYVLKKALCVLVGGLEVGVVGVRTTGGSRRTSEFCVEKEKYYQGLVFK